MFYFTVAILKLFFVCLLQPEGSSEIYVAISSPDVSIRQRAFTSYCNSTNEMKLSIPRLLDIISNDKTEINVGSSPKKVALYMLADQVNLDSDARCIDVLLKNTHIQFNGFSSRRGFDRIDKNFPAIRALLKIGQSASDPVIQKIRSTDDAATQIRLSFWLYKYYGQRYAIRILNDLLDENPKMPFLERKRLVESIEHLEKNAW